MSDELLPFSHNLVDNYKCLKCGTHNTANVSWSTATDNSPECLYVTCRRCGYFEKMRTKDAK